MGIGAFVALARADNLSAELLHRIGPGPDPGEVELNAISEPPGGSHNFVDVAPGLAQPQGEGLVGVGLVGGDLLETLDCLPAESVAGQDSVELVDVAFAAAEHGVCAQVLGDAVEVVRVGHLERLGSLDHCRVQLHLGAGQSQQA